MIKIQKFRKKPVIIEAFQLTKEILEHTEKYNLIFKGVFSQGDYVLIDTLEGQMRGVIGDWIITGIAGEVYPCKPDIFEASYELIKE